MKIAIINGPNLNLLGIREPGIYGRQTFEDFLKDLKEKYPSVQIDYFQSNVEGELINELQNKIQKCIDTRKIEDYPMMFSFIEKFSKIYNQKKFTNIHR